MSFTGEVSVAVVLLNEWWGGSLALVLFIGLILFIGQCCVSLPVVLRIGQRYESLASVPFNGEQHVALGVEPCIGKAYAWLAAVVLEMERYICLALKLSIWKSVASLAV
jgi:hypothetical protein